MARGGTTGGIGWVNAGAMRCVEGGVLVGWGGRVAGKIGEGVVGSECTHNDVEVFRGVNWRREGVFGDWVGDG
jgi:hypothetical protein